MLVNVSRPTNCSCCCGTVIQVSPARHRFGVGYWIEERKWIFDLRSGLRTVNLRGMEITYRGRKVTETDIDFIRELIKDNPQDSRRALSKRLCREWNWVQANGVLRDMVCRSLMLELHRAGLIKLPPRRMNPSNPLAKGRRRPTRIEVDTTPVETSLSEVRPLEFQQVRRSPEEGLYNSLIDQYHYLGYTQPVGEHLKYLIRSEEGLLGCMAWSSAVRHLGSRDRFIGWSAESRKRGLHLIGYNTRFLILPWVRVRHLASHILGQMARILPRDWEKHYSHPIYLLETFVDPERFRGTCYRAANWIVVGQTTGRGKDDQTNKPNRSLKNVLVYPLCRNFQRRLCGVDG